MNDLTEKQRSLLITASRGEHLTVQLSELQFLNTPVRGPFWREHMKAVHAEMSDLNDLIAPFNFLKFVSCDESARQAIYKITSEGLKKVKEISEAEVES